MVWRREHLLPPAEGGDLTSGVRQRVCHTSEDLGAGAGRMVGGMGSGRVPGKRECLLTVQQCLFQIHREYFKYVPTVVWYCYGRGFWTGLDEVEATPLG